MSGPGTGYLGGWTSRDEERKKTSKWKSSASIKRYADPHMIYYGSLEVKIPIDVGL